MAGIFSRLSAVWHSDLALRFRRNRNAMIGSILVSLVLFVALFGGLFAPYPYDRINMAVIWEPPGAEFLMGTDALGRDVFSRILIGARISMLVAASVLAITFVIGVTLGMIAGYFGGWADTLIMRTVDIIFAFPELILAILVAAVIGTGTGTVIVALSLVWWPGIARLTRSLVLSLREEMYIDAAISSGTHPARILLRHLLPNIASPLIVRASVGVGFIVMAEATLSFLGIGVQEPTPTWGGMIRDGLDSLRTDPHLALYSSLALGITIIGFNMLGDGLRDLFDPKMGER